MLMDGWTLTDIQGPWDSGSGELKKGERMIQPLKCQQKMLSQLKSSDKIICLTLVTII